MKNERQFAKLYKRLMHESVETPVIAADDGGASAARESCKKLAALVRAADERARVDISPDVDGDGDLEFLALADEFYVTDMRTFGEALSNAAFFNVEHTDDGKLSVYAVYEGVYPREKPQDEDETDWDFIGELVDEMLREGFTIDGEDIDDIADDLFGDDDDEE